jgi:hypothetical protein
VLQVILAVTAVIIAGVHLRPHPKLCLLETQDPASAEQKEDACRFTFVACGLTLPITAGVVVLEVCGVLTAARQQAAAVQCCEEGSCASVASTVCIILWQDMEWRCNSSLPALKCITSKMYYKRLLEM